MQQLSLIPESDIERLTREVMSLTKQVSDLRKGVFKRHGELQKKCDDTVHELNAFKSTIGSYSCNLPLSNSTQSPKKPVQSGDLFTFELKTWA